MAIKQIEVELQETMGSDAAIANAAWTSTYNKEKREDRYDDPAKVADLVRRVVRDGHSVPLESVVFRFWVRHPVFSDRQHMTHRIASHNGLSGRYRTVPSDFYEVPTDVREVLYKAGRGDIIAEYDENCLRAYDDYKGWLEVLKVAEASGHITNPEYKRARELLRGVLGTSFMVERTTIMNLLSFANYQRLRNSSHAQPEIKRVAELMLGRVIESQTCPVALGALMDVGWVTSKPNHEFLAAEDE